MSIRTVKVSNLSLAASKQEIKEFFSFSGDIEYVEMKSESEKSQVAYVTFKDSQGADTAVLLTGATIVDLQVSITLAANYQLPPEAMLPPAGKFFESPTIQKTEDVVSSMLAKGYILGKDVINKAKAFDEQHYLTSNASATVASLEQKIGLREKINLGTAMVNEKVREVDERFQVLEITKSALSIAEEKASIAGSAIMSNRFLMTGASWVSGAFNMVAKAAEDVSTMTKVKVEKAEEEKKETVYRERTAIINEYAQLHLDDLPITEEPSTIPTISVHSVD